MTKNELIGELANKSTLSQRVCRSVINAFIDVVTEAVGAHEEVSISGFGSFCAKKRAARTGRNPSAKEAVHIQERFVPWFNPSKRFRDDITKG